MPYYTNRQGVYPQVMIDDSPGWILVPDPPPAPEGKETIWLNFQWVTRNIQPDPIPNTKWKFSHSEFKANSESTGWNNYILIPQPYASWSFNTSSGEWDPPLPKPEGDYSWNEQTQTWDLNEQEP